MAVINQRIDTFLGLNNMLNPSSAEYREGMAYRSKNARIDEKGLWGVQQLLVGISGAPAAMGSPSGGGVYFKSLNVNGVEYIVNMGLGTSCDVGPNKQLYSTDGTNLKNVVGDVSAYTPPAVPTKTEDVAGASRAEDGTYYYICTFYDPTYKRESLPSPAVAAELDQETTPTTHIRITPAAAPTGGEKVRIYRSKRTSAVDMEYNATNIFFFLTEQATAAAYNDYLHDSEIDSIEYEGRGTDPVTAIGGCPEYLAGFNNRMLYFKNGTVYWSSAGRPQEVAAEYDVTVDGVAIKCKPKLSIGYYGEARYEITELRGHKVLAAFPIGGKLWVWTGNAMGYLEASNRFEGYKFSLMYEGVGVTSDKVLSLSPYGLFGADYQGIWLFTGTGRPKRLTDKRINLWAGEDTTYSNDDFSNSFGCYVPVLNEYWWGVAGKILAYQADRDIFVGPYNYSIQSGCLIPQGAYFGGSTPSPTIKDSAEQNLEFWFGQTTPTTIKDQVIVEVLHSKTPSSVALNLYQNSITSTAGAVSPAEVTYISNCGKILGKTSGRFFMLKITLTGDSPIATINYKYNPAGDTLG